VIYTSVIIRNAKKAALSSAIRAHSLFLKRVVAGKTRLTRKFRLGIRNKTKKETNVSLLHLVDRQRQSYLLIEVCKLSFESWVIDAGAAALWCKTEGETRVKGRTKEEGRLKEQGRRKAREWKDEELDSEGGIRIE
jgi:hypothetical protein